MQQDVVFYLDGVTCFTICCIGLVVNAAAIAMLLRQKTTSIFVKLMISLVTYDLIYVFLYAALYSLPRLSRDFKDHVFIHLVPYLMPVAQMSLSGSVFTTMALTLERYISVVVPFFRQRHNLKAWMFIAPVASFVVIYTIPRFFELETTDEWVKTCTTPLNFSGAEVNETGSELLENNATINMETTKATTINIYSDDINYQNISNNWAGCTTKLVPKLRVTELRFNPLYVSIYANWMNLIVNIVLPLALLVSMNIRIYRTMKGQWYTNAAAASCHSHHHHHTHTHNNHNGKDHSPSPPNSSVAGGRSSSFEGPTSTIRRVGGVSEAESKKRDSKYTRASVVMVVAFVVCNTPRFIPNVMELFIDQLQFPEWAHIMISINHLLTILNSSFNFLIYLSFCGRRRGKKRRRRRRRHRLRKWSTFKRSQSNVFNHVSPTQSRSPSVSIHSPRTIMTTAAVTSLGKKGSSSMTATTTMELVPHNVSSEIMEHLNRQHDKNNVIETRLFFDEEQQQLQHT